VKLHEVEGVSPQARRQLVEVTGEATVGVGNELGRIQWHKDWQHA
jgi:hypothetical protein